MPRKAAITPNKHLHTTIPPELAAKLDLFLWSEVEGKVPQGAYQSFIVKAIRDFFTYRELDLAPYLGAMPGEYTIKGNIVSLDALMKHLEGK
jgi:hypothetical protein